MENRIIISKVKQFLRRVATGILVVVLASTPITAVAASAYPDYRYVALGDSVAAGLGLESDTSDAVCGRSSQAYSRSIADYYSIEVTDLSCSGAKADEGLYGEQRRGGNDIRPQLETAFENGTPDLMTITIGANDLRWTQFIRQCIIARCGTSFDDFRTSAYLTDLRLELWWTFREIERLSNGSPPLVAISGYYNPFSTASCSDTSGITNTEKTWLGDQLSSLNTTIENAASQRPEYARYVAIDFNGHELCSANPWVRGRTDPAPLHPTVAGQRAIADAFITEFEQ